MTQRVSCPHCQKTFGFKPEMLGRRCKCPKCHQVFRVTDEAISTENGDRVSHSTVDDQRVRRVTPVAPAVSGTQMALATGRKSSPALAAQPGSAVPSEYVIGNQQVTRNREDMFMRGFSLMLFGAFLFAVAMCGFSFPSITLVQPVGALIGALAGCVGGGMVMSGLTDQKGVGVLLGLLPAIGSLSCGGLVIYLLTTGYWDSKTLGDRWAQGLNADRLNAEEFTRAVEDAWRSSRADAGRRFGEKRPSRQFPSQQSRSQQPPSQQPPSQQPSIPQNPFQPQTPQPQTPQQQPSQEQPSPKATSVRWSHIADVMRRRMDLERVRSNKVAWLTNHLGAIPRSVSYDSQSSPVLGVLAGNFADRDELFQLISVHATSDPHSVVARDGYALGALNVCYDGESISGLQCEFMKIDGSKLDPFVTYLSPWIGQEPRQTSRVERLSGDGRILHGVWFEYGSSNSIGIFSLQ